MLIHVQTLLKLIEVVAMGGKKKKIQKHLRLNDAVRCHVRIIILNNKSLKEGLSATKKHLPSDRGPEF